MTVHIGIIAEHKAGEGRIPLTPRQIKLLQASNPDLLITVSPSDQRSFPDDEFEAAGIALSADLSANSLVIAVKEIDVKDMQGKQAYLFFSHTIKGQDYNMPMLQHILDVGATLIDYELIRDDQDRRLVFFGRHAGLAGMVNSLWSYGQRQKALGTDTPFIKIKQAKAYKNLDDIKASLKALAPEIKQWMNGKPALVVGITGYGNVSKGAQEILDILPLVEISASELLENKLDHFQGKIVKVVFKESDMFSNRDPGKAFELQEYFSQPELYKSNFYQYLNKMHILVNCIYWNTDCPRLITLDEIKSHYGNEPTLSVVGDITCDIDGSIQFNIGSTASYDPVYVFDPVSKQKTMGFVGQGPLVMAVDNLPAELPREASESFGEALLPFVYAMGACDYSKSFEDLQLPPEIKRAVIAHQGALTPDYTYLTQYLEV